VPFNRIGQPSLDEGEAVYCARRLHREAQVPHDVSLIRRSHPDGVGMIAHCVDILSSPLLGIGGCWRRLHPFAYTRPPTPLSIERGCVGGGGRPASVAAPRG
jgi:hypothetical protein